MGGKERIKQAAMELFVKEGFSASTNSITKRAGVATGLLYHHYKSKNELIMDIYSDCYLEQYKYTVRLFTACGSDSFEEFFETSKKSFFEVVRWDLQNWTKFQYMVLVEGSILANQNNTEGHQEIAAIGGVFENFSDVAVAHGFTVPTTSSLNIDISRAFTRAVVEYLHDHPEQADDQEFMDVLAIRHCYAVGIMVPPAQ